MNIIIVLSFSENTDSNNLPFFQHSASNNKVDGSLGLKLTKKRNGHTKSLVMIIDLHPFLKDTKIIKE